MRAETRFIITVRTLTDSRPSGVCDLFTFPSCSSLREKESMKAWAMTDRQASRCVLLSMSKTNCGFLRILIQKRSGKLVESGKRLDSSKTRTASTESDPFVPVCLPDVSNVRVGDLHVVRLSVQEVEEVLDGVRRSALRCSPDGPEEVLHVRMNSHLQDKRDDFRLRQEKKAEQNSVGLSYRKKNMLLSFYFVFYDKTKTVPIIGEPKLSTQEITFPVKIQCECLLLKNLMKSS